jgi:hypothetical protein
LPQNPPLVSVKLSADARHRALGGGSKAAKCAKRTDANLGIAVERMIHGYLTPCASVRFSVRNTLAFSWALPMKSTPSSPSNDARYRCATSSLRCPFSKVTRSIPCVSTNRSIALTNRSLIGATIIVDGTRAPSWVFMNQTTPPPVWSDGT